MYVVVNKQFELFEFVFDSVYVDMQYNEISHTFTAGYVCLCSICCHVLVLGLSVRLSLVPYVDVVTVMLVLFVQECECDKPTPALCHLSVCTVVKLCTLGVLGLGGA